MNRDGQDFQNDRGRFQGKPSRERDERHQGRGDRSERYGRSRSERPDDSRHGDARSDDAYRRDGYENSFGQDDDSRGGMARMAYDRSYEATSREFSADDRYNQGDYGMGGYVRNSDRSHGMGNSGEGRYGQNVDQSRYGQGGFGQGGYSQSFPQNHGQGFDQGFRTYGDRARDRYVSGESMGARPSGQDFSYGRHGDNTPGYGPMGQGNYGTRYTAGQGGSGANYGDYGSPYSPNGGMGGSGYGAQGERRVDDGGFAGDPHDRRGAGAFGTPGSAGSFQMRGSGAGGQPDRGGRNDFGEAAMGYSAGMTADYMQRSGRRDALTGTGAPGRGRAMRGPKGYTRSDERVREDVCETLGNHHEIDASEIEVLVAGGVVTLAGTVEQGRDRRLAEEIVEHLPGVRDVRNEIRVNRGIGHAIGKAIGNVFGHKSDDHENGDGKSRVDLESRAAYQDFKAGSSHGEGGRAGNERDAGARAPAAEMGTSGMQGSFTSSSAGSPTIPASEKAGTLANPAGGTGAHAMRPASEALSNNGQAGSSAASSSSGSRSGDSAH